MAVQRKRNFATVVYPESAPSDWMDILASMCIPCFLSPLHDSDVNPDGEIKKPHYHILIMFDGVKTLQQVKDDVITPIGGVGLEIIQSTRGYARYLCHLDNPEKHQYNPDDITCFGGADYFEVVTLPTDRYGMIIEMVEYCKAHDIYSYHDLFDYCMLERYDWLRILCDSGTYVIKEYLKSKSWAKNVEENK